MIAYDDPRRTGTDGVRETGTHPFVYCAGKAEAGSTVVASGAPEDTVPREGSPGLDDARWRSLLDQR